MVVIVGDDVCGGGIWVLDLDVIVGVKGEEGDGIIVVEGVGVVLLVDVGLDIGGVGGVGVVLVLDFFKEVVVGVVGSGLVCGKVCGWGLMYNE